MKLPNRYVTSFFMMPIAWGVMLAGSLVAWPKYGLFISGFVLFIGFVIAMFSQADP